MQKSETYKLEVIGSIPKLESSKYFSPPLWSWRDWKVFRRWGHLTWPGDLTLGDLDLKFSGKLRHSCPNSYANNGGAVHHRFFKLSRKKTQVIFKHLPAGRGLSHVTESASRVFPCRLHTSTQCSVWFVRRVLAHKSRLAGRRRAGWPAGNAAGQARMATAAGDGHAATAHTQGRHQHAGRTVHRHPPGASPQRGGCDRAPTLPMRVCVPLKHHYSMSLPPSSPVCMGILSIVGHLCKNLLLKQNKHKRALANAYQCKCYIVTLRPYLERVCPVPPPMVIPHCTPPRLRQRFDLFGIPT